VCTRARERERERERKRECGRYPWLMARYGQSRKDELAPFGLDKLPARAIRDFELESNSDVGNDLNAHLFRGMAVPGLYIRFN